MKAIRFVFCLFAALMLTTLNGLAAEEEVSRHFSRNSRPVLHSSIPESSFL